MANGVDAMWTDLEVPEVELSWPDLGVRAVLTVSPTIDFIAAAAFDGMGAVAVEPQTHGPDGIRRLVAGEPGAPCWLEPGAALAARIELAFSRA